MSLDKLPNHKEIESRVMAFTLSNHQGELVLIQNLLSTYVDGFNLIDSFTTTSDNEVEQAWILLAVRSFHSMRCAMLLMQTGYYAQAMMLLRSVTEDWLICKDCQGHRPTLEALLYGKYRLTYKEMAIRVGATDIVYEQDYRFQSRFTHSGPLSLGIMIEPQTNEMRIAPAYNEALFVSCSEMLIRNAIRMTEFMEAFLSRLSVTKADSWREVVGQRIQDAANWVTAIREKYGNSGTYSSRSKEQS